MKRTLPAIIALNTLLLISAAHAKTYKLYYLGGQSNMDGFGKNVELPSDQQGPVEGVLIFHGNTQPDGKPVDGRGIWSVVKPGHGVGASSDGKDNKYTDRFGVELSFARRLKELDPQANIAIIKYSRGGTSLDCRAAGNFGCWDPDFNAGEGEGQGVNQYDHFLAAIRHATAKDDIDGDGEEDTLIPAGIVWMQGESDAYYTEEIAKGYQANLKRMMELVRAALRADDVPVAIGRISDSNKGPKGKVWPQGETVRAAQAAFCEQDGHAELVTTTDDYGYSDPYHYDSPGYLDLGKQFADALHKLATEPAPKPATPPAAK